MSEHSHYEQRARDCAEHAAREYSAGRLDSAVDLIREATVLYASADMGEGERSQPRISERAEAFRLCGRYLAEREEYAEAANIYQKAVDLYTKLDGEEAEEAARRCAAKLLDCIKLLQARPFDRLNLLIAQYEQRQLVYAAQPGNVRKEAECAVHIARILQRRERYEQSVARYMEAVDLYSNADEEPEVLLAIAECHQRMAGLLAYRLNDKSEALLHFAAAISLYALHEPYVYGVQEARTLCERAVGELNAEVK